MILYYHPDGRVPHLRFHTQHGTVAVAEDFDQDSGQLLFFLWVRDKLEYQFKGDLDEMVRALQERGYLE